MKTKILILVCCLYLNVHDLQAPPGAGEAAGRPSDVNVRTSSAEPGYKPGEGPEVPTEAKNNKTKMEGQPPRIDEFPLAKSEVGSEKKTNNSTDHNSIDLKNAGKEHDTIDLSKEASSDKSTMYDSVQVAYESVKNFFNDLGIKIKDLIASWSKISPQQVEQIQTDIAAIDSDYAQTASKELNSYLNLAKKIEDMSEGPDKDALQGDLVISKLTAVKSIIDLVRNDSNNPATLKLLQDLPSDMSKIVNEAVGQPKGIFDKFQDEQAKSSDENVSDLKNKQSERALAAQKNIEAKMKEKPTQTPEEALKSVQLKATPTNQPALFVDKDAQTDFSGVTKNAKPTPAQPSVDLFAEKQAEPAQAETQSVVEKGEPQAGLKDALAQELAKRRGNLVDKDEEAETDGENEPDTSVHEAPVLGQPAPKMQLSLLDQIKTGKDTLKKPKIATEEEAKTTVSQGSLDKQPQVDKMLDQAAKVNQVAGKPVSNGMFEEVEEGEWD